MNQHNMMQQFYEQQPQNNINGFPTGSAFHGNQQGTYNGSSSTSTPYRNQNGMPRYSQNENDSFESTQSNMSQSSVNYTAGNNYMDPRVIGFDPRNHSNYETQNGMVQGMELFSQNMYPGKGRFNEMTGMINPGSAFQRQRMLGPGSDNDFISPTNPYGGGFSPQQMAQMIQHQRYDVYQRQVHEQQVSAQQLAHSTRDTCQFPLSADTDQTNNNSDNDLKQSQNSLPNRKLTNSTRADITSNLVDSMQRTGSEGMQRTSSEGIPRTGSVNIDSDGHRNAAIIAASEVRAQAAASTSKGRVPFPTPNSNTMNTFPFNIRNFHVNNDQMPSPFPHNLHSPDYSAIMSPNKDYTGVALSPLSQQGRRTPRSGIPPPPYSPLPHNNDSNHLGSVKGSNSNISSLLKGNLQKQLDIFTPVSYSNQEYNVDKPSSQGIGSSARLSGTPNNVLSCSPSAQSPFQDDFDFGMSPSWPSTPASPERSKRLKSQASPRRFDQLSKIYEVITDEEKRNFLDRYLAFMSINGTPVTKVPVINEQPLDLYILFRSVCERGGINAVLEKHQFKEILKALKLPVDNSLLAYSVKEQYMKYLHAYEIKAKNALLKQWKDTPFDRNVSQETPLATISLNESLHSTMNDMKSSVTMNANTHNNPTLPVSSWSSTSPVSEIKTSNSSIISSSSLQYGPCPSYQNQPNPISYGTQNIPNYGSGQQDITINNAYPNNMPYSGYPNPMFPHGPLPGYNSMLPGIPPENMQNSWPRVFSPHQGPPELFPEGLPRMPWSQQTQRQPVHSFTNSNFTPGKPRSQAPLCRQDQLEQMKYHQQMKMPHYQHPTMQPKFSMPTKNTNKIVQQNNISDVKSTNNPSNKRDFGFPPDSVEGAKPLLRKRKKMTSKDLGPIEAWRIMMSLKSGLVAECSWAIDTLNILLSDNKTITYFHLTQLPGLLDTLMDHYRRCLSLMFKYFKSDEVPLFPEINDEAVDTEKILNSLWVGVCKNAEQSYTANIASSAVMAEVDEYVVTSNETGSRLSSTLTSHIQTNFPSNNLKTNRFPQGLPYESEADIEKRKRLERVTSPRFSIEKTTPDHEKNSLKTNCDKNNVISDVSTEQVNSACLDILKDLINAYESKETSSPDLLVEKVIKDLEFDLPCDKKYLEDSREFISYLNRRFQRENRGNVENEHCVLKQFSPFLELQESELSLLHRCVAMSNIFRSLSFIQGNDSELANNVGLLIIAGHLLTYQHEHTITDHSKFKMGLDKRDLDNSSISTSENEVWLESLANMRENTMVLLSNISGHLNLSIYPEEIHKPIITGLVHWLVCKSSEALDPLPTAPGPHALSPQCLSIETLAKITINLNNIELIARCSNQLVLENMAGALIEQFSKKHLVPVREFSLILLDNLARCEDFCKVLALRRSCVSSIVKFICDAERNTSNYLSSGGRVQPGLNAEDICGTSISLLRRSVNILLSLSKLPYNKHRLLPFTDDILALSTSQMIDTSVLALLAQVLFELSD
ncbi:AT-rich interactive domain-containing protein 1A [Hydra vulgaris]|uniref:AT-rich interactive domain-containing protein 1A n=1 Tax=Hydra vulgaris TaxID=6087 RepID=UPI001F5F68D3|nr:AT-rich interactive domain-containing protein 1A [Hydra vulgaris]